MRPLALRLAGSVTRQGRLTVSDVPQRCVVGDCGGKCTPVKPDCGRKAMHYEGALEYKRPDQLSEYANGDISARYENCPVDVTAVADHVIEDRVPLDEDDLIPSDPDTEDIVVHGTAHKTETAPGGTALTTLKWTATFHFGPQDRPPASGSSRRRGHHASR